MKIFRNKFFIAIFITGFASLILVSCQLFFPPEYYDQMVNKHGSSSSSSDNSSSGNAGGPLNQLPSWAQGATTANNDAYYNSVVLGNSGWIYACGNLAAGSYDFGSGNVSTGTYGQGFITVHNAIGTIQQVIYPNGSSAAASQFQSIAVDASANIYVGGYIYSGGNLDLGNGKSASDPFGAGPSFLLAKYDSGGTAQWVYTFSTVSASSAVEGIALDGAGGIYIAGRLYQNGSFTFQDNLTIVSGSASFGLNNILLAKFDAANGSSVFWGHSASSGTLDNELTGVTANSAGVWAVGAITGSGSTTLWGGSGITSTSSGANALICSYDSSGNYKWGLSTDSGTIADSSFIKVAIDSAGNSYAVGWVKASGPVVIGGVSVTAFNAATGNMNCLIFKFDTSGNAKWGKSLSVAGSGTSKFNSVTVDADGNIWAAGSINGTGTPSYEYDFGNGVKITGGSPGDNLVVVKYDPNGNALGAASSAATATGSSVSGITLSPAGKVTLVGLLTGTGTINFGNGVSLIPANASGSFQNPFILHFE